MTSRRCGAVDLRDSVGCVVLVLVHAGVVAHFGESSNSVVLVCDRLAGLFDLCDLAALGVADLRNLPFAVSDAVGPVARVVFDAGRLVQRVFDLRDAALAVVRVALDGHARFVDHAGGSSSRVVGDTSLLDTVPAGDGDTGGQGHGEAGVALVRDGLVACGVGYTSTQSYNTLDQPTDAKNPLNHTTRFTYDAAGRTTGVINEAGVTIESYTHDSQGRVIRVTDALQQQTSIEYDTSNRPNKITDRKGQVTQISYTERGQIASISQPGQTISYQYDAVGRLTEVRDNTSVNQYRYDAADRVTQIDSSTAAGSHRLGYEYDSLDRMTKRNLSGTGITTAEATTYAWDLAGRLLSHTTNIGSSNHKTDYEYDQAGRLAARHAQASTQGKLTQRYGYDQAERLAQIKYLRNEGQAGEQLIEQIDYSYDAKGQRTAKTTLNNHGAGGQETPMTATYDAATRQGKRATAGDEGSTAAAAAARAGKVDPAKATAAA